MIHPAEDSRPRGVPWLTWLACVLSVTLTVAWWLNDRPAIGWGTLPAPFIWSGRWGALVTTVFLHGGVLHLLFNLLWLLRLGSTVEQTFGHLEFAVFCLAAAFVSSGAELAVFGNVGVGMSGVVYALFGLVWGARRTLPAFTAVATDDNVRLMIGWMVLCFVMTELNLMNIANAAHAGGLLFGFAAARLLIERPAPVRHRVLAATVVASLITLTVFSVTWMPWSAEWRSWNEARQAVPDLTTENPE